MDILAELHNDLSNDLDRIKKRFKGTPRLSLIVRFTDEPDKGLYLTDDTKAEMLAQIEFLEQKAARVFEAKTGPLAPRDARQQPAAGKSKTVDPSATSQPE